MSSEYVGRYKEKPGMSNIESGIDQGSIDPWFALSKYKNYKFDSMNALQNSYDYIIVGAGLGGVSAAARLAENEPQAKIILVDAQSIGASRSGHNAGFISQSLLAGQIARLCEYYPDNQYVISNINRQAIAKIEKIKAQYSLDFDWRHDGSYRTVYGRNNSPALKELVSLYSKIGISVEKLDEEQLFDRLGTQFYKEGIFLPDTILDNPSEVIRGLATALPDNVSVFENVKVTAIHSGSHPGVQLDHYLTVNAKKIILAMNPAENQEAGYKNAHKAAIYSLSALTRPLKDSEFAHYKNLKPWGVCASSPDGAAVRLTHNRRIYIKTDIGPTSSTFDQSQLDKSGQQLRRAFVKRFPDLEGVNFEYHCCRLISFPETDFPILGEVARNVYAVTSPECAGAGVEFMFGHFAADLAACRHYSALDGICSKYQQCFLPP